MKTNAKRFVSVIKDKVNSPGVRNFFETLKYALHVIVHPFDGFWDLKHEKRGSLAAAIFIIFMTLVATLWQMQFTSFLFVNYNWNQINIWTEMAQVLLPLVIICVANWALTTLFDGKGTMKEIFMGVGYALTPYPLIMIPTCLLSNILTSDEGALYTFFTGLAIAWCAFLLLVAIMKIHEYTLGETLLALFATLVGAVVIVVLLLLICCMVSEAVTYFISLGREILLRFY